MRIASFAVIAALLGCGGKARPGQHPTLPDEPQPAAAEPKEIPIAAESEDPEDAPPPVPTGPIEIKIPAQQTTVKLVGKGKGKLAPLRYAGKVGGKQQVELVLDFTSTTTMGAEKMERTAPTILLAGEAETKAVDKDGRADYAITVSGTDVREVAGAAKPSDEVKQVLASLVGLVIGGDLAADGTAGDVTMRVEKPDAGTVRALGMLRLTLPVLPRLPAEPVGVGAKWQTTTTTQLAEKIIVTQVTDYELVATKGNTWSIKGQTTVSGADQELHGGKISSIHGTGTSELTLAAGALYPSYKTSVETQFTASEQDQSMALALRIGGAVTAK